MGWTSDFKKPQSSQRKQSMPLYSCVATVMLLFAVIEKFEGNIVGDDYP